MEIVKPHVFVREFDREDAEKFIQQLDGIVATFGPEQPIVVQIDSYGGEAAGLSMMYNKLKSITNPIVTYTSSVAMSCGFNLLCLGAEKPNRVASEGALLLFHEISSGAFGDVKDMQNSVESLKKQSDYWSGLISSKLGYKSGEELIKAFKEKANGCNDFYLTAQQALELGIIDMIGDVMMTPYHGYDVGIKPSQPKVVEAEKCKGCGPKSKKKAELRTKKKYGK